MQKMRAALLTGATLSAITLAIAVSGPASAAANFTHAWNDSPSVNECLATSADTVGQPAIMWTCDSEPGQQWIATVDGNNQVQISTPQGGCLDSKDLGEGSRIYVEPCVGSQTQGWYEQATSGDYIEWANYGTGYCISVSGGSTARGASVISWKCQQTPDQFWGGSMSDLG